MTSEICRVQSRRTKKQFIDFPHRLYNGDYNYVPELNLNINELLSKNKNPFFQHSNAQLYLALNDKKVVGRIAVIDNKRYNSYHKSNVCFFGFFDCINDQKVAQTLLDIAIKYGQENKFDQLIGPTNFTTNDTAGVLVEGFDKPPTVMMTYNYQYYGQLLENMGFSKAMDLYAYFIPTKSVNDKSLRITSLINNRLEKKGIVFRNINTKKINDDLMKIKHLYKQAWENNWGFVPPTDKEFEHMAAGLKLLIDSRYVYIAEKDGEAIGFGAAIPNINEITIGFKRGKLFPFNIFKLLYKKKKVKSIRILLLGVIQKYRRMGIEAVMFGKFIENARINGLEGGEASWILESNTMMIKAAENLNGIRTNTYRLYSKSIK